MAAPPVTSQPTGTKIAAASSEDSLWDVDFDKADMRISARRMRIKNRISAARKIRKMIQIKHIFGYHSTENRETFPVEAQCDASRALIENVIDNGSELVTNIRLAADHLQVQHRTRHDTRNDTLTKLLKKEDEETNAQERSFNCPTCSSSLIFMGTYPTYVVFLCPYYLLYYDLQVY